MFNCQPDVQHLTMGTQRYTKPLPELRPYLLGHTFRQWEMEEDMQGRCSHRQVLEERGSEARQGQRGYPDTMKHPS